MKGVLYIVATPIGNLEDITYRAIRILREAERIVCEDTRVTSKLLAHYAISKPLVSYHHHSSDGAIKKILNFLEAGENIAVVCDAGTPGVSDPGNKLVQQAVHRGVPVVPIPGVSAVSTLASVAGIDMQKFCFFGFVPHKKGRKTFFETVRDSRFPIVYFDSVHRVTKNLDLLDEIYPEANVIVGRELTKQFEEILRGTPKEIQKRLKENPETLKGEFTIIVS